MFVSPKADVQSVLLLRFGYLDPRVLTHHSDRRLEVVCISEVVTRVRSVWGVAKENAQDGGLYMVQVKPGVQRH